ncbi:Phage P22-like portal protein [uncultured Caudovirales phage]|uniref:Phage P22-like portal protein n=1 Tax=uncultured Caudovirales phage TaxID=2100421 RepID=A0A6J5L2Y4_9CAUD|nr:Phage P22-like portal protein [uncultured Caudovirales phage]
MDIAKKYTDRLKQLKKSVEEAQQYFHDNVERYEKFLKFVFKSSLDGNEEATLADRGLPTIEFNILEAYISRLRGEFAKQQPSLTVRAADGVPLSMLTREFTATIEVIEAHLRAVFFDGTNDMLQYNIYSDLLAGGFSVIKVYTDYINEMSFEQNICVERSFNPTLCVFDPLARASHKGDGRFCAELYPMTKKEFSEKFGEEALKDMKFTRSLSGFDWSFQNEQEEIVLVCDYYEKQMKKETILKLSNGHTVTEKDYDKFLKEWEERGLIEQPPVIVKKRKTMIEKIIRYRFCESMLLDVVETDYKYLPLVFIDGNSVNIKENGSYSQVTRPYVYHAIGIQRLKNLAGQSLGNELENTIQHKFIVALESIPVDYQDAYQNVQKADTLIYNHFLDTNNPTVTLPPPREVVRTPIPPQIMEAFRTSDEMTQVILGSYDGAAGQNNGQMSGIAFARSSMQSNTASLPFMCGLYKGLDRVAQIMVDLLPKYYRTPRSLPVLLPSGKREYFEINKKGSLYMNYDPNHIQVNVEMGVNFAMQKEIALQTIIALSQASPAFAQFFNQYGLPVLLDNIDIRGIDDLKEKAQEFQQQLQQQQQMAQQQQQQQMQMQAKQQAMEMQQAQKELQSPTQGQIEVMAIQERSRIDAGNLSIKERDSETKFLDVMSKIRNADVENELKLAEIDAENTRSSVESALNISKHMHETSKGVMEHERI